MINILLVFYYLSQFRSVDFDNCHAAKGFDFDEKMI